MATARLVPSTYAFSNTQYLSISNAGNMYHNTDNSTYATVTNSQSGTTSYYIYIRGFNFSSIPSNATVSSFTVKLKARQSGVNSSSSYSPKLCHGTSQITSTCSAITDTANTYSFTGVSATWEQIIGYDDDFGIRINCRRASRNTTGYMYIYGAEILVEYTVPNPRTITSTLTGNGTISPSGAYSTHDGETYTLTITPSDTSDTVTATYNGTDITSELVSHYASGSPTGPSTTVDTVLGTYSLVSGGFNGSGASYFQGIVGHGVDASKTTTNYYSSGSGTIAVFQYAMHFTIPANAVVTRVYCQVNGHAESTSNSSEYMCVRLKSGDVNLSDETNFKNIGTSNTTTTLEANVLPTAAQLQNMVLECRLGYYGGAINGATCYVEYAFYTGDPDYYTYSFVVDGDATIAVAIGTTATDSIWFKVNGSWVKSVKVYKKVNGSWVEQIDLTTVFSSGTNYVLGST